MSLRQHALGVTALGQLLASCALPAVTSPTTPALPAAASAAPPAAADPSRAPAEPLPGAAATSLPAASSTALPLAQRLRLTGQVRIGKTAVARARLTLFDLATGAALVAKPWNEAPSLRLQAGQALFSDDAGAFDLELPPLAPDQVIKLVASLDGRTFVTLLAPVTAAPAGPTRSALPYALTQDPAGNLGAQVTLSPEDTAVAKTFEGVFKLILLQAPADRSAALGRALSAARQAVAELQGSLSGRSELAAMLLASVGSAGEIVDRDQFRTALARAGAFGTLNRAVQSQLGGLRGAASTRWPTMRRSRSRTSRWTHRTSRRTAS
ncbi:MAG: hypothetical protein VKP62_00500 [Candidatus Sericytochromatia bacterium]|nr:hypothetical protein [Candidatus Sericytochromatia bacterium]